MGTVIQAGNDFLASNTDLADRLAAASEEDKKDISSLDGEDDFDKLLQAETDRINSSMRFGDLPVSVSNNVYDFNIGDSLFIRKKSEPNWRLISGTGLTDEELETFPDPVKETQDYKRIINLRELDKIKTQPSIL